MPLVRSLKALNVLRLEGQEPLHRTAEPNRQFGFGFGSQGRTEPQFGSEFGLLHFFPNWSELSSNPEPIK